MSAPTVEIHGPWRGCACGKRATTFFRRGQWCDACYPGWDAVKHLPPAEMLVPCEKHSARIGEMCNRTLGTACVERLHAADKAPTS